MGHVLRPLYDGKVGLSLLAGPANAGKVALLLERYLARLDDEPVLIVPNASDVDRVERDLLARRGCLFSGEIVTFDRLFELLVRDDPDRRPVATDHQRALIVRRAVGGATLNGLTRLRTHERLRRRAAADARRARVRACSTRRTSTATWPGSTTATAASSTGSALWDLDLLRRRAAERLQSDLDAWHGEPVFAYGFEDLTSARVVAARGARGPRRRAGLAPVRARA